MLKFIAVLFFVLLQFLNPTTIFAHTAGQVPFFKVNGVYSNLYPVPTTSLSDFQLPQDDSPATYLVNTPINFEIDVDKLPIPPEVVKTTNFIWDFGDGEKGTNTLNTHHAYKKAGSYFLVISAQTPEISEPQLIQSVVIQVVPTKDYKLPKSVIEVNGKYVKDPLMDTAKIEFGKEFSLDASSSESGGGKIVEYFWDLGNGKSVTGPKITYKYEKDQYAFFPVLRVKDENGLINDSFVQITNSNDDLTKTNTGSILGNDRNQLLKIIGLSVVGVILVSVGGWFIIKRFLLHKSKH